MFSGSNLKKPKKESDVELDQFANYARYPKLFGTLAGELVKHQVGKRTAADVVRIFDFLLSEDKVMAQLDELESGLQSYASGLPYKADIPTNHNGKYCIPHSKYDPKKSCYKILSGYFDDWGKVTGFKQKAKIIGQLAPEEYQSLLVSLSVIKDSAPVLDARHGKWSHMIQWWCVINASNHNADLQLQTPPLQLFKAFGSINDGLWDLVFDQDDQTQNFTSPEYVTTQIIRGADRWPILSGTLYMQQFKMRFNPFGQHPYKNHIEDKHADSLDEKMIIKPYYMG